MSSTKKTTARDQNKKLTSRQLQALRTKDNIYESALRVISELGYENTSIEAITTAAGVSTGSFYTYFTSREHILIHTFEKSEILYQKAFDQTAHLSFPDNLYEFIGLSYLELELRGKEIMNAVTSNMLSGEFKAKIMDHERLFFRCLRALIQSGLESDALSSQMSVSQYVDMIFTILVGTEVSWCMSNFAGSLPEIAKHTVCSLMDGLLVH